jgi:methionyl-tRNA synthetase
MTKRKSYITTAIDYTNSVIHIGHAYEKILADVFARYHRLKKGDENVGFTTGTDEHGTTNEKAAKERRLPTLQHVTEVSKGDKDEIDALNVSYDRFIRTTDKDHKKIASDFFKASFDAGDIYKGSYEGLYCEGCEAYKTLTELNEDGQCPNHTTREIQKYEEENYFFKWSKYSSFLTELVSSDSFAFPEGKKKEMLAFIKQGLQDIPVTRPKYKLPWGITCPIDEEQVIYVWFDALINYYTFGSQKGFWDEDTEIIHFVGKDIARWHILLWPAMLKSVGYRLPDKVYVHGFINLNGEKISKSKGNVIQPSELVKKYGADAVRYYLLRYGPIVEDADISIKHFEEVYNGELANGLGNTVSRVAKLAENMDFKLKKTELEKIEFDETPFEYMDKQFRTDLTLKRIWELISKVDAHINEHEPWKSPLEKVAEISFEITTLVRIAKTLKPFMPETAEKILKIFDAGKVKATKPLFPRLD